MTATVNIRLNIPERGNVLFLILIAVALFAALSYAVTQSSRSGGGDANNETNLISSAQVTQYPASVRTAIIRMMVSNSTVVDDLEFNPPSDFSTCTTPGACVFHPDGGGATFAPSASDVTADDTPHEWKFNGENEVNFVGTTAGGDAVTTATADVMAILPNIKRAICEKINAELGITGAVPTDTGIDIASNMGTGSVGTWVTALASGPGGTIGEGGAAALNGQAFGCFQQPANTYHYYHVLIEQ